MFTATWHFWFLHPEMIFVGSSCALAVTPGVCCFFDTDTQALIRFVLFLARLHKGSVPTQRFLKTSILVIFLPLHVVRLEVVFMCVLYGTAFWITASALSDSTWLTVPGGGGASWTPHPRCWSTQSNVNYVYLYIAERNRETNLSLYVSECAQIRRYKESWLWTATCFVSLQNSHSQTDLP